MELDFWIRLGMILIAAGYVFWMISINVKGKRKSELPVETDRAAVYCKHPEPEYIPLSGSRYGHAKGYVYRITFHTESGLILKLYMDPDRFHTIPEGSTGLLTWQGDRFWNFVTEEAKGAGL